MYFRSIDDMNHAIIRNLGRVPADADLVVGIPRSGLLAANMISLYLNIPMTDLEGLGERRLLSTGKRPLRSDPKEIFSTARRILVVDDCVSTGAEMQKARAKIDSWGFSDRTTFLAVYSFPERQSAADIVFETVARPMSFQWSCMHTPGLENHCVDMDGILCPDATPEQDDDGTNYEAFLRDTRPLIVPTREIGWIVTCRLEKYRSLTEAWLDRHGIRYRDLVMMQYPDRETRERDRQHAAYKALVYRESGARLFIESNPGLARQIAEESGLPVMCFSTNEMLRRPVAERLDLIEQRLSFWWRRLRRAPKRLLARATGR
jgi:uncharacterized HAD superfamily protein/hypoxanthine phosphoribosyltransferase